MATRNRVHADGSYSALWYADGTIVVIPVRTAKAWRQTRNCGPGLMQSQAPAETLCHNVKDDTHASPVRRM
jgi:hypothetical protein